MRKAGLALVVLAVAVAGCGGSDSTARAREALHAVFARSLNPWHLFPAKPGSRACTVYTGGVVSVPHHGTCSTLVTLKKDGSAVVRLHGWWDHNAVWHFWEYSVSTGGRVIPLLDVGTLTPGEGM